MLTALLLLPVASTLIWLYWYCLPTSDDQKKRWRWADSVLLMLLCILSYGFIQFATKAHYEGAGPVWPELVAAVGAYAIFAIGLAIGLFIRRRPKTS